LIFNLEAIGALDKSSFSGMMGVKTRSGKIEDWEMND
jgi:hypothetical protein